MATLASPCGSAAAHRLGQLAPLDVSDIALIDRAELRPRHIAPRTEIVALGAPVAPAVVLSGWACGVRLLSDGRRQIVGFRLPGDLIGLGHPTVPQAMVALIALTDVALGAMPRPGELPPISGLPQVYAASAAIDEFHLLRNVTRLGRYTAYERVADLLVELYERLRLAGLAANGRFALPLTQETMADALGLTSIHVNRTLQAMRRDGIVSLGGGMASLHDPEQIAAAVNYDREWLAGLVAPDGSPGSVK